MTERTALEKNAGFAEWLAEWVKENEKSCVRVDRAADKQEGADRKKPLRFKPTGKTESVSDRVNPKKKVAV